MNKIAVIQTGGKQYKVEVGQKMKFEKLDVKEGDNVRFETLLISGANIDDINIGTPSLGNKVTAKVISHGFGKKVSVIKFKNKTRYKRNIGHRQPFTEVEILEIV